MVEGYIIPFNSFPIQNSYPKPIQMDQEKQKLVNIEIQAMLEKGAIIAVPPCKGQFLSSIFLVEKKVSGQRPVINLKNLNSFIPYDHFKMEGLHLLKEMLQEKDYLCKLDLKDAYFSVPLHKDSQKFLRFQWEGKIYQFLCLCFGLAPAPRLFTKLMKILVAVIRRLNGRIIVFLDDILLIASTKEDLIGLRDTLIFLLQQLGFMINLKKSVLSPCQQIEFLGVDIDTQTMMLSLPKEKVIRMKTQCVSLLEKEKVSLREVTQLVGRLSSAAIAILPAPLQYRGIQRQQILGLNLKGSYESLVTLDKEARLLELYNGRSLIPTTAQVIIQSDASKTGWGAACQNRSTGGLWSKEESLEHINFLELKAAKLAILTFVRLLSVTS